MSHTTSAIVMVYGCGHVVNCANGDTMHPACPACHPPPGEAPWKLGRATVTQEKQT